MQSRRLRRTSPDQPGWTRRRSGRGFSYLDQQGRQLPGEDAARVKALVIPPAWTDVWISPVPHGHLQAVGTDAAGRRQYLYHPAWRARRDELKFDRVYQFASALTDIRDRLLVDLALSGMPEGRACALAVRLLDLGYFRIGNDVYADRHGSFGLTTLERRHVRLRDGRLQFRFVGKSGVEHRVEIEDALVLEAIEVMRRRRNADDRLLAYLQSRRWRPLESGHVNDYLREVSLVEATAKDFRTWHATVLAALALGDLDRTATTRTARRRAVVSAVKQVAEYLGNTPSVARASYIDPLVLEYFDRGLTIGPSSQFDAGDPDVRQASVERAVLDLLAPARAD